MFKNSENEVRSENVTSSLETGNIYTTPIGYIESCFKAKNGTPRQPTICSLSRGCLKISKSVFNNPEHSLIGLEQFSHVWILFVFHKNGRLSCKAKVQPPRLNGAKTGVFSTRSPHRPNAIGLTLARLEKVEGGTIYLSGIDIIHGTPVLDIKPYIAEYDSPQPSPFCVEEHQEKERQHMRYNDPDLVKAEKDEKSEQVQTIAYQPSNENMFNIDEASSAVVSTSGIRGETQDDKEKRMGLIDDPTASISENQYSLLNDSSSDFASFKSAIQEATSVKGDDLRIDYTGGSFVPSWVRDAPVSSLKVRFTPHSEMELKQFKAQCDSGGPSFSYFQSTEEAKCAITTVLSADPRSVYRRKQCQDRLFYFSLDTIHITCWFGDGFVEVVRIKPLDSNAEHQSR
ncbi:tRNA (adenine(37)-N6)-methyltransferase [Bombina bombina]|uniref:tRNA (adenine(37)-N6)-methyltransferase n=1 Tax=Bombina bombina TaxID=8345 RepID=UPI00235ABAE2|nr:tRNA (adenine(37)-N6)-methyltransferase [Bombina bombina]